MLAASPDKYFYHWIAITQTGLFLKRVVSFWLYDYQFYTIDYCYFANLIQAIFVWVYPDSRSWYLLMCGVAGVGHVTYLIKNKLMFHDLDKYAGATLHLMPALMFWNIHWNTRGMPGRAEWGFYDPELIQYDLNFLLDYFKVFWMYYIAYCIFYYSVILSYWNYILENDYYCFLREQQENKKGQKMMKNGFTYFLVYFSLLHCGWM